VGLRDGIEPAHGASLLPMAEKNVTVKLERLVAEGDTVIALT
jgi:hypothetical protein